MTGRRGSSGRAASEYNWTQWQWDPTKGKEYRWRENSKGKSVSESRPFAAAQPRDQSGSSTSAVVSQASSSPPGGGTQYSSSNHYGYGHQIQETEQSYNPVDQLSGALMATSLPSQHNYTSSQDGLSGAAYQQHDYYSQPESSSTPQQIRIPSSSSTSPPITYNNSIYTPSGRTNDYETSSRMRSSLNGMSQPFVPAAQQNRQSSYEDPLYLSQSYSSEVTITEASHSSSRRRKHSTAETTVPPPPLQLINTGVYTNRPKIRGTSGDHEGLDKDFKLHDSWNFIPGHIFKVVWAEPMGESITYRTDVTNESWYEGRHHTKVVSKVRRFIIVATGKGHSQCVPILTYGYQGLNKSGAHVEDHAQIYTAQYPPQSEDLSNQPIEMIPKSARHKLQPMSLINYAKIYPVEHNVKVMFIGWVAQASQMTFVQDFDNAWSRHKRMDS